MIQSLYISNYAIIDELKISFSDGFNVITGETGAGKSILLGALGLIMGNRADTKILFDPNKKSIVEAEFNIESYEIEPFFSENDLDYEPILVIRREISSNGKSRVFVNDTPVKLNILKTLGDELIDMHRQFDMLDIHNRSFQMKMLDALANNRDLLTTYQSIYKIFQNKKASLAILIKQRAASLNEMDFLQFQLTELHEVALDPEIIKKNESTLESLNNAEEIKQVCLSSNDLLIQQEQSLVSQLSDINRLLQQIENYNPNLTALRERIISSIEELSDIASTLSQIADNSVYNEEDIQVLQDQLDIVYKLQNKHRVNDIESLISIQSDLEQKINSFENLDQAIVALEESITTLHKQLIKQASIISNNRKKISPKFEKSVIDLLSELGMPYAQFKIAINAKNQISESGLDDIEYMFSANKGHQLQSLKEVASGGEISRLTLCIKSLVAKSMSLPTLIYDEIDAGVSGEVANKMAFILRDLSKDHQIINITHSPQIASKGQKHFFIYKEIVAGQTKTNMKKLSPVERELEIAKMLSGDPPSPQAIENAKVLLQ